MIEVIAGTMSVGHEPERQCIGAARAGSTDAQWTGDPERLAAVLRATPDLVGIADPAGRIQYLNSAGRRLLGIGFDEDVSRTTIADYHPERLANAHLTELLARAAEAGSWTGETYLLHRDGSEIPVSQAIMVHKGPESEVQFVSTIARDIRESKRVESRLRLREQIVESASEGIMVTAPWRIDNPIVFVNPAFERMTGYKAHDVVGRNWRFLVGPATDPAAIEEIGLAVKNQQPFQGELLTYRAEGTSFWSAISIAPLYDDQGRMLYFVVVMGDVSHRRQLEEHLRQSQKMEAIGRLAGGVAHDFNNVLTVIMGSADRAAKTLPPGNDALAELIHDISDASNRAAGLTRQLLAFSRKQVLAPRHLDINELISQFGNMLRRLVGAGVTIEFNLAADVGQIYGDQSQLEQVLLNLAVNGRDAMPNGGKLTIDTRTVELDREDLLDNSEKKPGPHVRISVSDTGEGMEPEVLARAFEPFFTTKKPGEGTGMGLATVFGVVKQSEGHVTISSKVGHGTTFRIYLPCADQPVAARESNAPQSDWTCGTETILLVDDNEFVLRAAAAFLQDCGYTVLQAADGTAACEAVVDHVGQIDLLVTDVVMPGVSGPEVAERLSALRPGIKILFASGYSDDAVLRRGNLGHAAACLQKPYNREALLQKVRQVLDAPLAVDTC